MLHKSRGIALHTVKFSETSIIAKVYTELFGLQSYLIKGIRKQHSKLKAGLFQPLTLLDLTIYYKETGGLQSLKEVHNLYPYQSLPFDIMKSSIALFINELIYKSIREEEPNQELFDFLFETCTELDSLKSNITLFPLLFTIKLTRYLGFMPQGANSSREEIFNMKEGIFQEKPPDHKYVLRPPLSGLLKELINPEISSSSYEQLTMKPGLETLKSRNDLLVQLLVYYKLHLPDFREIRSHQILHSILA
jgi:DNA repair protein RecO (recombination protein O)